MAKSHFSIVVAKSEESSKWRWRVRVVMGKHSLRVTGADSSKREAWRKANENLSDWLRELCGHDDD